MQSKLCIESSFPLDHVPSMKHNSKNHLCARPLLTNERTVQVAQNFNMTNPLALSSLVLLMAGKTTDAFNSGWEYREARNCTTIMDIICDNDNLATETLCEAIRMAGLEDDLNTDTWTVFAPINAAFDALPETAVSELLDGDNTRRLIDLIAFHTVPELSLTSTDLKCDSRIFMGNEDFSVTICEGDKTFQVGRANPIANYPQIVSSDIEACNGIVHTLSEVMLFEEYERVNSTDAEPALSTASVPSSVPSDGPSLQPSSSPSAIPSDGPSLQPSVSPSSAPSDGPSLQPSTNPSAVPSDGPSLQPSTSPSAVPSDGPSLQPSTIPSAAPSDGPSLQPSISPSAPPTDGPSLVPSLEPSFSPSSAPSDGPSLQPSSSPSSAPSDGPSLQPSTSPSAAPSDGPSLQPSLGPSFSPSNAPSDGPSLQPSISPSGVPTDRPSLKPSYSSPPSDGPSLKPSSAPSGSGPQPCTITEIVCDLKIFTHLCAALHASAGLDELFNQRDTNITLFAPTDEAFAKLGPVAVEYLMDEANADLLRNILMFHTVGDSVIMSKDLECTKKIKMDSGRKSRTVCTQTAVGQKGSGNSATELPEIIEPDIESCSGVIHVINEVMLYKTPEKLGIPSKSVTFAPVQVEVGSSREPEKSPVESQTCKTIDQLVCDTPDFSILCNSIHKTGLWHTLTTGTWTLFAPTNEAFLKLPPADVEILTSDAIPLSRLLMYHLMPREIMYKDDLPCKAGQNLITMANGKDSRTLCEDQSPKWQKGKYNPDSDIPEYVLFDMKACNGIVHGLDGVMLYRPISEH